MIDKINMSQLIDGLNDIAINRIGAVVKILDELVELEKVKKHLDNKFNSIDFLMYFKSYEFCVCYCLEELAEILRNHHTLLGFQEDRLFNRAYDNVLRRSIFPKKSKLCKIAINIFGLINLIFKAKNYEELWGYVQNVNKYALQPFKELIFKNFDLTHDFKDLSHDEVILRLARSYFHYVLLDGAKIRLAYEMIVQKGNPLRKLLEDDYFQKELEKKKVVELDSDEEFIKFLFNPANINRTAGMQEKLGVQLFFKGYKLIIDYLWDVLFDQVSFKFKFLNKIALSKDWREFDQYYEKIKDEIIIPMEKLNEAFDFINIKNLFSKNNKKQDNFNILWNKIHFSVKPEELSDKEKIDEYFLWYRRKVINSDVSIACANEFIVIFMGLLNSKRGENDLIRIIRFIHPSGDSNNFSYAILIEGPYYSYLSDYAGWYVFLNFATDHSGTGWKAKQMVDQYINLFESKIHLSVHEISLNAFKRHLRDIEIKKLRKKVKKLEEINADKKGFNFELVTSYIFSKLGYETYWRLKNDCSDYTEIDLIAYKRLKQRIIFYIVEITSTKEDLMEEVKGKIKILKKNSSKLLEFLKLEQNKLLIFRGMVLSNIKTDLRADKMVKIINYKNIRIENRRIFKIIDI